MKTHSLHVLSYDCITMLIGVYSIFCNKEHIHKENLMFFKQLSYFLI